MEQVDLKQILIDKKAPLEKYPKFLVNGVLMLLNKVFHVREINDFISKYGKVQGIDFIRHVFENLNFQIEVKGDTDKNIPKLGPLIVVANHPLGALDGLGIVKVFNDIRKDSHIVVNDILSNIDNLDEFFLPVDLYGVKSQRQNLLNISKKLKDGSIVIFFPAGKVSRLKKGKIMDEDWSKGAITMARKFNVPLLPVFIDSKNTLFFYYMIKIKDFFAPFLLPREMFKKRNKKLTIKIGKLVTNKVYEKYQDDKELTELLKKAVYQIEELPNELKEFKAAD